MEHQQDQLNYNLQQLVTNATELCKLILAKMNHLRMIKAEAAAYLLIFGVFENQKLISSTQPSLFSTLKPTPQAFRNYPRRYARTKLANTPMHLPLCLADRQDED